MTRINEIYNLGTVRNNPALFNKRTNEVVTDETEINNVLQSINKGIAINLNTVKIDMKGAEINEITK